MQISQAPQSLKQSGLGMQASHACGSSRLACEQLSVRRTKRELPSANTSQHPKQSQPLGVNAAQFVRQRSLTSQLKQAELPRAAGTRPYRHSVLYWQPSLPLPEFPSKKQSWQKSTLSPGMPVANVASSASSGPVHSGSSASTSPSWSSSTQLVHAVLPFTQSVLVYVLPVVGGLELAVAPPEAVARPMGALLATAACGAVSLAAGTPFARGSSAARGSRQLTLSASPHRLAATERDRRRGRRGK
jgi:hypothetical protein